MKRELFEAYEGSEPYVFISYSHKDSEHVFPIIGRLKDEGFFIWYDEGIVPGSEWPESIANHLDNAHTILLFVSPNAIASDNVRREINFALSNKKRVIAVHLEQTELTLGLQMQLNSYQSVYFYHYSTIQAFMRKLCKGLKTVMEQEKPFEKRFKIAGHGQKNISYTPSSSDRVCVRNSAISSAEYCDVYIEKAANYTLFNRFIDRPLPSKKLVDERSFLMIREINSITGEAVDQYVKHKDVEPGKAYQVHALYHNNATTLAGGDPNPLLASHNARIKFIVPKTLDEGEQLAIDSVISWDTPAQPGVVSSVWNGITIASKNAVTIQLISGAMIHMNELDKGNNVLGKVEKLLPSNAFSDNGTLLGHYDNIARQIVLDGIVFGCIKYSGYVTFGFRVDHK